MVFELIGEYQWDDYVLFVNRRVDVFSITSFATIYSMIWLNIKRIMITVHFEEIFVGGVNSRYVIIILNGRQRGLQSYN